MQRRAKLVLSVCFLLFVLVKAQAQTGNNLRTRFISTAKDTVQLDSLSVVPGTFFLQSATGDSVNNQLFTLDFINSLLIWNRKALTASGLGADSVFKATFRVFPRKLNAPYAHKTKETALPERKGLPNPFQIKGDQTREDIFKFDGLQKSGAISRGISFGNNQDVVVNSNLNLQLSGKLGDNIELTAAITDDNIPIQPDGNTQQLQDFDRVYIQLATENTKLIAGDFQINRPESYFMNFNKRLKGGSFSSKFNALTDSSGKVIATNKVSVSAAIARGRFARNQIQGVEGNQGPYRLRGNNNEVFIIILSGSEKVYIDGRLLKRGQENDYVIDYNTAEIVFTSKILITKDLRLFVEFEYADNNFSRTLFHFGNDFEMGNLSLHFNAYSEQDLKNQPLQQTLDAPERALLDTVGDNLTQAVIPNVDTVAYTNNQVLYAAIDTLVNGVPTVKYKYSTDSLLAKYRVGFSLVGANQGNYVQVNTLANGKVYQWIDPIGGVRQGSYEPVVQLIPPRKKQMFTLGGEYKLSKNFKAGFEAAYSVNDLNTFSDKDSQDDGDVAFRVYLQNTQKLSRKDTIDPWMLKTTLNYEQVNKNFSPLERFRNVEFDRDWNLATITQPSSQYLPGLSLGLGNNRNGNVNYRFTAFLAGPQYSAYQNAYSADLKFSDYRIVFNGSQTQSKGNVQNTGFIRHRANVYKTIKKKVIIGYKDEFERNLFSNAQTDTLLPQTYSFYDFQLYVSNADTSKIKIGSFYRRRTDWFARDNQLNKTAVADWAGANFELMAMKNSSLKLITTFRSLKIVDTTLTPQKPDNSLVNRLEYSLRILKGAITTTTFYEVGSGLEARKQFSYVQVPPGQGVYAWVDYNSNGVKELNEFEISPFPDQASYIRIFTPTTDFVKTYSNQFNQVLNISADKFFKEKKKGIKKFISRFSNQTTYRIERKTSKDNILEAANPFSQAVNSQELISLNSSARNTFYYNRNDAVYGIDLNWQDVRSKTLMVNGFDTRITRFTALRTRYNVSPKITLNLDLKKGNRTSGSEFLSTRNFNINYYELEPRFIFQPGAAFRLTLNYIYADKRNTPSLGGQRSVNQNAGVEIKYNQLNKGSLQVKFNYINISFNDQPNSPLAYEMLEGLRAGQNMTWNLIYQRNLGANLQISLTYDGRKPQSLKTVHTGGMQLRALF